MAKRIQHSLGQVVVNAGVAQSTPVIGKYELDNTKPYIIFDVIPMGAVRMSSSDRWKTNPNENNPEKRQRACVTQYFNFKDRLREQARQVGYEMGKTLNALYLIPMPQSWSEKKKKKYNGMPCESKPDTDNITKALKDTLKKNDEEVWYEKCEKRWAYKGSIIIFT